MWFFYCPNIIYGDDAVNYLEQIAGDRNFIVTNKNLEKVGFLKILTDKFDGWGKHYEIFNEISSDKECNEDDILKGKTPCISYEPDTIIALGGGSVIDAAKTIWGFYEFPEFSIDDFNPFREELKDLGKKATFIAIPTTSGTGSETTWAMVISRILDGIETKCGTAHRGFIPHYAVLDPIFPAEMPPKLTAGTAFDALAHSFEGLASSYRNEFSNAMGLKAIELVFKYLPIAYKDPKNLEVRDYLHQAATMAGLCFGNGQAHLGHSFGHPLGAAFHIPHGYAVGLMLPYISQYCLLNPDEADVSAGIYAKIAKQLNWAKWEDDDKKAANNVVNKIKELMKEINFPLSLKEYGIQRELFDKKLESLVTQVIQDPCTSMSPRNPSLAELEKILKYAYEGKNIDF
ncbi:MAG: iron-containing alcohol dehydrogenase [Promethearchaeota archaeon]